MAGSRQSARWAGPVEYRMRMGFDYSMVNRAGAGHVALETTLLCHGVPRGEGAGLARQLRQDVEGEGAKAAVVGVVNGRAVVGMTDLELAEMLSAERVEKAN